MQPQESLTPAQQELERALGSLRPAVARIDRDELMFQAGRQSVRAVGHGWQVSTIVLVAALGASLLLNAWQGSREPHVVVQAPPMPQSSAIPPLALVSASPAAGGAMAEGSYLRLRDEVLAKGADALPEPQCFSIHNDEALQLRSLMGQRPVRPIEHQPSILSRLFNMGEGS